MKKPTILLLLFFLASISCRAVGLVVLEPASQLALAPPATVTIVSWNAAKGGHPRFRADLDRLIETEQPDVICLQESHEEVAPPANMGGIFARSWSYPWPGGRVVGVTTLSRVPALSGRAVPSWWREFFVTAPKVSLVTEHPLAYGRTYRVVNLHCLNFERWGTLKLRAQLARLSRALEGSDGPLIVIGDFNTWSARRLERVREFARGLGLVEITRFPPGRTPAEFGSGWLEKALGVDSSLPLDRAFSRGFRVRSASVLPYYSSDHRPIRVDLEIVSFDANGL